MKKAMQTKTDSELKAIIADNILYMQTCTLQESHFQVYEDKKKAMNAARMEIYYRNKIVSL